MNYGLYHWFHGNAINISQMVMVFYVMKYVVYLISDSLMLLFLNKYLF